MGFCGELWGIMGNYGVLWGYMGNDVVLLHDPSQMTLRQAKGLVDLHFVTPLAVWGSDGLMVS